MCFGGVQAPTASPIGLPQAGGDQVTAATDAFLRRRARAKGFASTVLNPNSTSGSGVALGSKTLLGS